MFDVKALYEGQITRDWLHEEVEAIIGDYLAIPKAELAGTPKESFQIVSNN